MASGAADLASAIDRVVRNLDEIASGVTAMHGEFVGMRKDIRKLDQHVMGLNKKVESLDGRVEGIEGRMQPLLDKVDALILDLDPVRVVAARFGGRKARRAATPPAAEASD